MQNAIEWTDAYKIGIQEIDTQHQYLFELVNETLACSNVNTLQLSLVKLYQYTREHFTAEEELMKRVSYPEFKEHQASHNKLLEVLTEKSNSALKQHAKTDELNNFLMTWLCEHIIKTDMQIGTFLYKPQQN